MMRSQMRYVHLRNWLEAMVEPVETNPNHSYCTLQVGMLVMMKSLVLIVSATLELY